MYCVFQGKAVNISTGEDCLQKHVASTFGARLAEEKNTGRLRLVLPEGNKQHSSPHIVVVIERNQNRQQ